MAQSTNTMGMETESMYGTQNTNAVDAIADAIMKAVDNRVKKNSKENTNTRKGIINALGYKPVSVDKLTQECYTKAQIDNTYYTKVQIDNTVPTLPSGQYTLSVLITSGFIQDKELRIWIPIAAPGKNISVQTAGNVSVRHSTDGHITSVSDSGTNYMTKDEFDACTLYIGAKTSAGFRLRIASEAGWFKSKTSTAAQNNMPVSVSFDTALVVTVT